MNPEGIDWRALERLRHRFLDATAGHADYWSSEEDLANYDATLAQRIGWKWDFALQDLRTRAWQPPPGVMLDWGCGTGVAARAFLDHFGSHGLTRLHCFDRSAMAARFAAGRARARFPELEIQTGLSPNPSILLLSHVLTELEPGQIEEVTTVAANAVSVLWVEPGTPEASRGLIAVRELLRGTHHPVAPCPHRGPCGLLAPGNERHWCHQFASPPPEVFADPFWKRFANVLGIDLRSVPLSYLVMDRRPPAALPSGTLRRLGRPRVHKADVRFFGCDETEVSERTVTKRTDPGLWRDARKGRMASLLTLPSSERIDSAAAG